MRRLLLYGFIKEYKSRIIIEEIGKSEKQVSAATRKAYIIPVASYGNPVRIINLNKVSNTMKAIQMEIELKRELQRRRKENSYT